MKQQHSPSHDAQDEGYFASFTDMLVGIIFIFIILLMIVANDYQSATESVTKMSHELDEARNEARDRARDVARDKERDTARDKARDTARDTTRDTARDTARDTERDQSHDKIIESQAFAEGQASALQESQAHEMAQVPNDAFSLQKVEELSKAKADEEAEVKRLTTVEQNLFNDSRGKILLKIQEILKMQGVPATADANQGILIIPEPSLFDAGQNPLHYRGRQVIDVLANTLNTYLPCIAPTANPSRLNVCGSLGFSPNDGLDVVFIDDYPDTAGSKEERLLLSVQHTVSVFGELKVAQPYLNTELKNKFGVPVLNIKVNQERRNAKNQDLDHPPFRNSLALRFVMRQPTQEDIVKLKNSGLP